MPKLKFKRTPEEEAEHQARKAKRKEKRKRSTADLYRSSSPHGSSSKRAHKDRDGDVMRKWASSDEDDIPDTTAPSPRAGQPSGAMGNSFPSEPLDFEARRAEMEEELFQEKMFGALGEDERLDGLESHLNDYVHVPDRWKTAAAGSSEKVLYEEDDFLRLNPSTLDDDEYAEWIRLGMYRKSHAVEHAVNVRRKAAAAERRAAAKAQRAEARRLEKLSEEERRSKKREREVANRAQAKEDYHAKWKFLLDEANSSDAAERQLEFNDIPWPIYQRDDITENRFTKETISKFLLTGKVEDKKARKDILRETFLRFHPDKFEGRFMRRVKENERERVREAIGQISRVLNHLLEDNSYTN